MRRWLGCSRKKSQQRFAAAYSLGQRRNRRKGPIGKGRLGTGESSRVAQTFLSAGSRNFPVPFRFRSFESGDWKVPRIRRQECLRYGDASRRELTLARSDYAGHMVCDEKRLRTNATQPLGFGLAFAQRSSPSQARGRFLLRHVPFGRHIATGSFAST